MLAFLKKSKEASASTPTETIKRNPDEGSEDYDPMHEVAKEIIAAVHSNDFKALAKILKASHDICATEPHQEGEHI